MPGTDDWYRNHFPVVIETNKHYYFNEKIYNEINLSQKTFPTLEYGAVIEGGARSPHNLFTLQDKERQLMHIFNKEQVEMIVDKVGRSIFFTHMFTELAKARSEDVNFEELLELDHPAFQQVYREFEHRINKLYTHPLLGDLLDSGEIDFAVLNALEQIYKVSKTGTALVGTTFSPHSYNKVIEDRML